MGALWDKQRHTMNFSVVSVLKLKPTDLLQREGRYPVPPQAPKTLGVEFSGVIESLGNTAESDFRAGDEVFGLAYGGESFLKG